MGLGRHHWLLAFATLIVCGGLTGWASAAPDRLDDKVPDATPDEPGAFAASLGFEWLSLEGALTSQNTNHNMFKVRYQFNPKVHGSIAYKKHGLAGAEGLLSPLFNQRDNASVWSFDVGMNLLSTARVEANGTTPFTPGSAFTVGVGGDFYDTSAGAVSESTTLLKAYLMYSTDLTEELRAHTYFSSGRLSGDGRSGSVNTIGAGLDYELVSGENPLTLMANGTMDIYNFRDPAFNTSRVSRFDLGLRYKAAPGMYTSLGWMTVNDSENDASGSGLFAGLNWIPEKECLVCDPVLEEKQADAPAQAADRGTTGNRSLASAPTQQAPMMENAPALDYPGETLPSGLRGTEALITANAEQNSSRSNPGNRVTPPLPLYAAEEPVAQADRQAASASSTPAPLSSAPEIEAETTSPVLLEPGRNVPVSKLPSDTLEKVYGARESVDAQQADDPGTADDDTPGSEKPALAPSTSADTAAEEEDTLLAPITAADITESTDEPVVIDEVVETASTPADQAQPELASIELDTALTEEPAFVAAEPEAAADASVTSTEEPSRSNKYTRSDRFAFPEHIEKPAAGATPVASPDPAPAAEMLMLDEAPDSGLEEQAPAAEQDAAAVSETAPATDSRSTSSALTPVPLTGLPDMPATTGDDSSTDVVLAQLVPPTESRSTIMDVTPVKLPDSIAPQQSAPVPASQIASSTPAVPTPAPVSGEDKPRHVQSTDRMQRPPVSEAARSGLTQLMTAVPPQTASDESAIEQDGLDPELLTPAGENG